MCTTSLPCQRLQDRKGKSKGAGIRGVFFFFGGGGGGDFRVVFCFCCFFLLFFSGRGGGGWAFEISRLNQVVKPAKCCGWWRNPEISAPAIPRRKYQQSVALKGFQVLRCLDFATIHQQDPEHVDGGAPRVFRAPKNELNVRVLPTLGPRS